MDGVQDSTWVNLSTSIDEIERAENRPKKRGVREVNSKSTTDLKTALGSDVYAIITSPLSQREKLNPVPELSAVQIEALRALYAMIENVSRTEAGLEATLKTAVKLLSLNYTPKPKDEVDGNGFTVSGTLKEGERIAFISTNACFLPAEQSTSGLHRSTRLAGLPQIAYNEEFDEFETFLDEDKEDDKADGDNEDEDEDEENEVEDEAGEEH
ncbi:hypothetical protein G7Y89_g8209 [Cudoniella acicularis]|uniref:Uncharacterized protein n=1 Tax=Cudoniella acicularis TaxID=354080 RepID=A0A8H4RJT0_9HELO|nr:hypothetical protein G7Y89_g8209 [Cudoniella acicularis]